MSDRKRSKQPGKTQGPHRTDDDARIKHAGWDISQFLRQLFAKGFRLPLHVLAVDAGGGLASFEYSAGDDGNLTATLIFDGTAEDLMLPLNIFFVDCRGEAARAVVRPGEKASLGVLH